MAQFTRKIEFEAGYTQLMAALLDAGYNGQQTCSQLQIINAGESSEPVFLHLQDDCRDDPGENGATGDEGIPIGASSETGAISWAYGQRKPDDERLDLGGAWIYVETGPVDLIIAVIGAG